MSFNIPSARYARNAIPLGMVTSNRDESIYNSGEISMTQMVEKLVLLLMVMHLMAYFQNIIMIIQEAYIVK